MKKILFLVALVALSMAASAQFYVGGSLGFGVSSSKTDNGDKLESTTNFSIFPEVGYSLNDRMDLGLVVGFGMRSTKPIVGDKIKSNNFEIAPYFRYSFVEFGKFKVMGRAAVFFAHDKNMADVKTTSLGLSITPMLSYSISNNFVLLANLNFCDLGFSYDKIKDGNSTVDFNLGLDSNNLLNTGAFQIGFAYTF